MIDEEVLFGLVQAAQDQQAAVEKALRGLELQRAELGNTISRLQMFQATVTISAENGVKEAIKDIGTDLNASLTSEVDKTRAKLHGIAEDLERASSWLTWRWVFACVVLGVAIGYIGCWAMWTRDLAVFGQRLDVIEQTLQPKPVPVEAQPVDSARHKQSHN